MVRHTVEPAGKHVKLSQFFKGEQVFYQKSYQHGVIFSRKVMQIDFKNKIFEQFWLNWCDIFTFKPVSASPFLPKQTHHKAAKWFPWCGSCRISRCLFALQWGRSPGYNPFHPFPNHRGEHR